MFFKYLFYIIKHKWFVMIECFKKGLIWRGLVHDLSKFLPDEFFPYMLWFNGKWGVKCGDINHSNHKKCLNKFDIAWLKHQHRNKHHYQFWYLRYDDGKEKNIHMPYEYKIEMLCDWIGAGKAITGKNNIKEWWNKTKDKKKMNERTFSEIDNAIRRMS